MNTSQETPAKLDPVAEAALAMELITRVTEACPERVAGSASERRAQELVARELLALCPGRALEGQWAGFRFSRSLYAANALHLGAGVLGTAVSGLLPAAGLALHLLAGTSYVLDSTRRAYLLRRLVTQVDSQNFLLVSPAARGAPRLRLVLVAHADAAYTGYMFSPDMVRGAAKRHFPPPLGYLLNPVVMATYTQFMLAGFDLARCLLGPLTLPLRPLELLLTLPGLGGLLLHLDVLARGEVVPGANDNLTGVAGLLLLARRLLPAQPEDVELCFVVSGAEESGTGGAYRLCQQRRRTWGREETAVLALDSLSNGQLVYFDEGELLPLGLPPWLAGLADEVAGADPRFAGVRRHRVPIGASDATPFRAAGYDALGLGCVDPEVGAPRHYHLPSDLPENLEPHSIVRCVDFTEALARRIYRARCAEDI